MDYVSALLEANPHYRQCYLHHIAGHTGAPSRCHCGKIMTQHELASHGPLGCTRTPDTVRSRPPSLVFAIETGYQSTMPSEDLFVDVTIANAACKARVGKSNAFFLLVSLVRQRNRRINWLHTVCGIGCVINIDFARITAHQGGEVRETCSFSQSLTASSKVPCCLLPKGIIQNKHK